jgi:hypothetical protein
MVPSLFFCVSTFVMIPFGGPTLLEITDPWAPVKLLAMWLFLLLGYAYAIPALLNRVPMRRGLQEIIWPYRRQLDYFAFLGRCTLPAGMTTVCLVFWADFLMSLSRAQLEVMFFILAPALVVLHFAAQLARDHGHRSDLGSSTHPPA